MAAGFHGLIREAQIRIDFQTLQNEMNCLYFSEQFPVIINRFDCEANSWIEISKRKNKRDFYKFANLFIVFNNNNTKILRDAEDVSGYNWHNNIMTILEWYSLKCRIFMPRSRLIKWTHSVTHLPERKCLTNICKYLMRILVDIFVTAYARTGAWSSS